MGAAAGPSSRRPNPGYGEGFGFGGGIGGSRNMGRGTRGAGYAFDLAAWVLG